MSASSIPFRLDLAGSWHDQPFISKHADGSVITVPLVPDQAWDGRSGLASSTRKSAIELWPQGIPESDCVQLGRILFRYDNPPGTKDISGSQDALGIVLPGVNRLHYGGGDYWPMQIESVSDEAALTWIENVIRLVPLGPRTPGYDVLAGMQANKERAAAMAAAVESCWNSLVDRDAKAFGTAMRTSFEALVTMLPNVMNDAVAEAIDRYRPHALGWKLAGAGGGGYLVLVTEKELVDGIRIRIARR